MHSKMFMYKKNVSCVNKSVLVATLKKHRTDGAGRDLLRLCSARVSKSGLPRRVFSCVLSISSDGDSTTWQGNLF